MPEVELVEIGLEDLLLRVPPLERGGEPRLLHLAQHGALGAQEPVLDQLLGDGAAALHHAPGPDIGPEGAQHRPSIQAAVVEEALVFRGEHSLAEVPRDLGQTHRPIGLARLRAGAREHLGRQRQARHLGLALPNAQHAIALDVEPDARGSLAHAPPGRAQHDVPAGGPLAELAGPGRQGSRLLVAEPREEPRQVRHAHVHAGAKHLGRGVHERAAACIGAAEARELGGGVRNEADDDEQRGAEPPEEEPTPEGQHAHDARNGQPSCHRQPQQIRARRPPPDGRPSRSYTGPMVRITPHPSLSPEGRGLG